jgi:hypothetical protein
MRSLLVVFALALASVAVADDFSYLVPLNDLGTAPYRFGYYGGLFEDGSNVMAADHLALGLAFASKIQPLDAEGHPSADGRIGFLAIGFGETARIMQSFMSIATDDRRVERDKLVMVNGAHDGADYRSWAERPDGIMPQYGTVTSSALDPAGITPLQVQVAWVQVINDRAGWSLGVALADAYRLKTFIAETLREMKRQYPNLQIVYLSSRVYGGYDTTGFNPEPYAYETGYSNRWIVTTQAEEERMEHPEWHWDTRVSLIDPRTGIAPWVTWGPYLWANGATPRSDGLAWLRGDFEADGLTLSPSGAVKGGKLLFEFLLHEPTSKGWFLSGLEVRGRLRAARR